MQRWQVCCGPSSSPPGMPSRSGVAAGQQPWAWGGPRGRREQGSPGTRGLARRPSSPLPPPPAPPLPGTGTQGPAVLRWREPGGTSRQGTEGQATSPGPRSPTLWPRGPPPQWPLTMGLSRGGPPSAPPGGLAHNRGSRVRGQGAAEASGQAAAGSAGGGQTRLLKLAPLGKEGGSRREAPGSRPYPLPLPTSYPIASSINLTLEPAAGSLPSQGPAQAAAPGRSALLKRRVAGAPAPLQVLPPGSPGGGRGLPPPQPPAPAPSRPGQGRGGPPRLRGSSAGGALGAWEGGGRHARAWPRPVPPQSTSEQPPEASPPGPTTEDPPAEEKPSKRLSGHHPHVEERTFTHDDPDVLELSKGSPEAAPDREIRGAAGRSQVQPRAAKAASTPGIVQNGWLPSP